MAGRWGDEHHSGNGLGDFWGFYRPRFKPHNIGESARSYHPS